MKLTVAAITIISFATLAVFGFAMMGHAEGCAGVCLSAHIETIKSFGQAIPLAFSFLASLAVSFLVVSLASNLFKFFKLFSESDFAYQPHALAWLALHENSV